MRTRDIVIVGGGNAGISLAARLQRLGIKDVAVISPNALHLYRPLLNYVAAGQATMKDALRPMRQVMPAGCSWIQGAAASVDADNRVVTLDNGEQVGYRDLVIAAGMDPAPDLIPGLSEAHQEEWAVTAHLAHLAEATSRRVTETRKGTVVFNIPPEPSPCGGTALKPLFMAADQWSRAGVLGNLDIHLVTPYLGVLDVPHVERELRNATERFNIAVHHNSTVTGVDHIRRTVTFKESDQQVTLEDVVLACLVPHYRAPAWVRDLAGDHPMGLVKVAPTTMAHRHHRDVWALGDIADLQTRPSGGALRRQVAILAQNIINARAGVPMGHYDGYTIIPITLSRNSLLLAEFDRAGTPQPTTTAMDLTTAHRSLWAFDRYVEPRIYFNALLKGRV